MTSIADEIEAAALGPVPMHRTCVAGWSSRFVAGRSGIHDAIMDALEADSGDGGEPDWGAFCEADETLQRMFLLSVAESLR